MYFRANTKMSINVISAFLLTLFVIASIRSSKFCWDGLLCSCCSRTVGQQKWRRLVDDVIGHAFIVNDLLNMNEEHGGKGQR